MLFAAHNARSRRSSVWTPASLTNLRGWYRADDVVLVGSDVDTWTDKSGTGNHLSAASAGVRPAYSATGFAGGSQPYASGDGVSKWIRDTAFSWGASVGAMTYVVIAALNANNSGRQIATYAGTSQRPVLRENTLSRLEGIASASAIAQLSSNDLATPQMVAFAWDGASSRIYRGTTLRATVADAGAAHADGAAFALCGSTTGTVTSNIRIAEAIVMRAHITSPELTSLYAYASARYGV